MPAKIAVCRSLNELRKLLDEHQDKYVCLYLAHKVDAGWDKSTSRVYMNQLWPDFIYAPIDIKKNDNESLIKVWKLAKQNPKIVAINVTQPHKSSPVILRMLGSSQQNVDTLVKNNSGSLRPLNLNGPSFISWLKSIVEDIAGFSYIILGVGGVGEPIARELATFKPRWIWLIDPKDKHAIAGELPSSQYVSSLAQVELIEEPSILINSTGKEGAESHNDLLDVFKKYEQLIYIDLRPQLSIPEVKMAKQLGLKAYTGYGMNTRNDYTLVEIIAKKIGKKPPSFQEFQRLVASAS